MDDDLARERDERLRNVEPGPLDGGDIGRNIVARRGLRSRPSTVQTRRSGGISASTADRAAVRQPEKSVWVARTTRFILPL